jgi:hypothetical protein
MNRSSVASEVVHVRSHGAGRFDQDLDLVDFIQAARFHQPTEPFFSSSPVSLQDQERLDGLELEGDIELKWAQNINRLDEKGLFLAPVL